MEGKVTDLLSMADGIMEYDSDTFHAGGHGIKYDEAIWIARALIQMMWENDVDGVILSELLDQKRNN